MADKLQQERLKKNSVKLVIFIVIIILCSTILFYSNKIKLFSYRNDEGNLIKYPNITRHFIQDDIHVVIVCGGKKFNEILIGTIKSILFNRRRLSNITFHIITDSHGQNLTKKSLNLSNKSCTKFQFYDIKQLLNIGERFLSKHQITNTHYSGLYSLSKAFISDILPGDINDVLLVDTDVLFVDDIYSVWKEFQLFQREKTAFGLVPWYPPVPMTYVYKGSNPDRFIAGVVLLDLKVCRSINISQLFDQVVDLAYKNYGLRSFWTADQVILNLFATHYPEHFVSLPCYCNGHTYHYTGKDERWKLSCNGEHLRNIHVVPSDLLLNDGNYLGYLYRFFKEIPIDWIEHCGKPQL